MESIPDFFQKPDILLISYSKSISNYSKTYWLSPKSWPKINQILSLKEKLLFYSLVLVFLGSTIFWISSVYISKTNAIPAYGGEYIEGVIGQPIHLNPVLSSSNDVDRDLTQVIYSGLLKYDSQGNLINDLADSYDISDDKTTYTFHLKNNVTWHDGEPLTAQDVAFTVNLISDPSYKSPLRSNWQGIDTNLVDDYTIEFKIKNPYVGFLHNLTFGILPKHIWETVTPDNFSLANFNLEPIGSGPYKYNSFQKDSKGNILSYKLVANPNYFEGKPYISKITFNFYSDESSLIDAYNRKEVMGASGISAQKVGSIKLTQSTIVHKFDIPRYFAIFFNQTKSVPLASDEVRQALNLATNRQEIIDQVLDSNGHPVYSPILPGMIGYAEDVVKQDFDLDKANQILEDNGWKKGADGTRSKNNTPLTINIVTTDWEELAKTAEIIKNQWEKVGAKVTISSYSISDIQQNYIRPREYEALLFGQVTGADPDPFSFWHSSQKKDPGLNLSLFGNSDTDELIDNGRVEFDNDRRADDYKQFQEKLVSENPAVFLYSPEFIYPVNKGVHGVDDEVLLSPSKRFTDINKWYIKTKRVWK